MGYPENTYGPFPSNIPERDRFREPSPTHQEVERRRSGGLQDSPLRELPIRPVGPEDYKPFRLR